KALSRVGINQYIENVYCYRTLGLKKPSQAFYDHILKDLGASISEVVMIGDGLEKDIKGALDIGIQAIWYNSNNDPVPENIRAIENLLELVKT
ncbi:MAG: HAD-IA family hydrolase, partial [Bacteroidota bacterium]